MKCGDRCADMLLIGDWWRRSLRLVVLMLIAVELTLLDARPMRFLFRRHGSPRTAAWTDSQAASVPLTPGRWEAPCAGSTAVDTPVYSASLPSSSSSSSSEELSSDEVEDLTSPQGRRRLLRRLARQMRRLADRVDRLKLRYVSPRTC